MNIRSHPSIGTKTIEHFLMGIKDQNSINRVEERGAYVKEMSKIVSLATFRHQSKGEDYKSQSVEGNTSPKEEHYNQSEANISLREFLSGNEYFLQNN